MRGQDQVRAVWIRVAWTSGAGLSAPSLIGA
jgi:hypothetical protein